MNRQRNRQPALLCTRHHSAHHQAARRPGGARRLAAPALLPSLALAALAACSTLTATDLTPPLEARSEEAVYAGDTEGLELHEAEKGTFDTIARGLEMRALPAPTSPDPLLTRAARLLGDHARESDGPIGTAEVRAALEVAGAYDTFVHHEIVHVDDPAADLPPSDEALADFLDISAERTANVVGVGWVPYDGGGDLILLSAYRVIDLEPTPRRVERGEKLRIKGELLEKGAEVHLVVNTGDTATSTRMTVPIRSDSRFSVEFDLPEGVKMLDAELVGVGQSWGRSFATLRFHADAPPTALREAVKNSLDRPVRSLEEAHGLLLDRINRHRTLLGLTVLRPDPGLNALAELDAQLYAVGESPEGSREGVAHRLEKWGVFTRDARLILARANDLNRLLELVWFDPTRRKRLLDPDTTHLGLAIIDSPPQASARFALVAYITEPRFDQSPAADLSEVLEALNKRRAEAQKPAVANAPAVAHVANRYAYPLLAEGKVPPTIAEAVVTDLRRSGITFEYVLVDIQAAAIADQMKFNKEIVEGDWKNVAVAVARGPFARSKTDVLVAIIVATR